MNCTVFVWWSILSIVVFLDRLNSEALDTIVMEDDDLIYLIHDV